MKKFIEKIFYPFINGTYTPKQLALSFCVGAYLAFSPFIGIQTWLVFPVCWMSGLSAAVALASLYLIGNPFTLVPIIVSEYFFGKWLVNDVLKQSWDQYNPVWLDKFMQFLSNNIVDLEKHIGSKLCFWCFMIGANIIAILVALISYPIIKYFFSQLIIKKHENNHSK